MVRNMTEGDPHKEHVGRRMREALSLADEAGLEPVYFRERKMRKMRS